jgi:hypothetical protein
MALLEISCPFPIIKEVVPYAADEENILNPIELDTILG